MQPDAWSPLHQASIIDNGGEGVPRSWSWMLIQDFSPELLDTPSGAKFVAHLT